MLVATIFALENLQRHKAYAIAITRTARDTAYREAVVVDRRDGARNMCTVVVGSDIATICHEVVAVDVIDIAIAIVIDTRRAIFLSLVYPHIVGKVGVVSHHSAIAHRNNHAIIARGVLPSVE